MPDNEKNRQAETVPPCLPEKISLKIESFIREKGMAPLLGGGVLLAFSGGADSTLLFLFFSAYCRAHALRFEAFHLHHGIRGAEADRDAAFCREFCRRAGVPFHEERADIPAMAAQSGAGLEETARKVRYQLLAVTADRQGLSAIATAHTASDLAETVLFRLARGTGLKGLCGIPAVRGNIVRPLLSMRAEEVRDTLKSIGAPYVNDSTNGDAAYSRNYIRGKLIPGFLRLNPSFPEAVRRMALSLSEDADFLGQAAEGAFADAFRDGALSRAALRTLHPALCMRVLLLCHARQCAGREQPEQVHLSALREKLVQEDTAFSLSFPDGVTAVGEKDRFFFRTEAAPSFDFGITPVRMGKNLLKNGWILLLTEKNAPDSCVNVYRMLIQRNLSSAKIRGNLYIRSRRAGDSWYYGGMTHRLKKLLSGVKLPAEEKAKIPVLCDEAGIVWVPGFGARDDGEKDGKPLFAFYYREEPKDTPDYDSAAFPRGKGIE